MFLITSAAYLGPEFTAEFGRLPPSFLPVGNRRLFEWQAQSAAGLDDRFVLSVPQDFEIPEIDLPILERLKIEIVRVPPGLSLGASIVYCINVCRAHNEPLRVLHGDTLCGQLLDVGLDAVTTSSTVEFYTWAEYSVDEEGRTRFSEGLPTGAQPRQVLCGYFTFSDASLFVQCVASSGNQFVAGLDAYSLQTNLATRHTDDWYDFGHIQLYYQSKSRMTTQRSFNSLAATKRWIQKSSTDQAKMVAEASWFEQLPGEMQMFIPHFLGRGQRPEGGVSYKLEYLYLSTLSELFVFGRLPTYVWVHILSKCDEFLTAARSHPAPPEQPPVLSAAYRDKTLERLEAFARASGLSLDEPTQYAGRPLPSLRSICEETSALIPDAQTCDLSVWHGDFCFSNIFYDFRAHQVRTIDPRGRSMQGQISIYGDLRYDVAKLAHCILGRYDFIVPGFFHLDRPGPLAFDLHLPQARMQGELEQEFARMRFGGHAAGDPWVLAMTLNLFLSMLPLHDDDPRRQAGLLANALRLYARLDA